MGVKAEDMPWAWVRLEDIVDCERCRNEGRGNWPVSPYVGHCRRCGWTPPQWERQ